MINDKRPLTDWLPVSREELDKRGWDQADVILISGDAYVDHPSFGAAVIGRIIESYGFRVAILPQPNWRDDLRDFKKLGKPRLFFGITAGNMDSMVNHYTANKRLRSDDAYTAGGAAGFRPDYATVEYTRIVKQLYPDVPVILGGIEASMRRLTHYDYWSDSVKKGILSWSGADMLVYGMAERSLERILGHLSAGKPLSELNDLEQTVWRCDGEDVPAGKSEWNTIILPSHEECLSDKKKFALHFKIFEEESNRWQGARLIEREKGFSTVVNPPYPPMKPGELDQAFDLPYTREPHPRYKKRGAIPAFEMIRNSINLHRGCFGGCSFCAISAHQGKFVASRSVASILKEINQVAEEPEFKGHITDLGGPSANMYLMSGIDQSRCMKCRRPSCIYPSVCRNLNINHRPMIDLYKQAEAVKNVKRITIGSGIRYDMIVGHTEAEDKAYSLSEYLRQVVTRHVSGRLKVAPEHSSSEVLKLMRKPHYRTYQQLLAKFNQINASHGMRQQLIPYYISSHPGSKPADMAELACETKKQGFRPEQVQDFTPTPMTLSTTMYYTGIDPYTGKPVYTARTKEEKLEQQRFFFWYKPENKQWLQSTLRKIGRSDLIPVFGLGGTDKRRNKL